MTSRLDSSLYDEGPMSGSPDAVLVVAVADL